MASPVATGKRRRPASAQRSPSPPFSPCQQSRVDVIVDAAIAEPNPKKQKKRRLESTTAIERPFVCVAKESDKALGIGTKRRRSGIGREETTTTTMKVPKEVSSILEVEKDTQGETKRRRVEQDAKVGRLLPPLEVPGLSPLVQLTEQSSCSSPLLAKRRTTTNSLEEEEKSGDKEDRWDDDDIVRHLDDVDAGRSLLVKDVELFSEGAKCPDDCENVNTQDELTERERHRTSLRSVQVTPPPSTRMLDRKNPPPPPKRPKRRNYRGIVYARTYPRLALSPLVDDSPPTSPRVFRSLENEFAFAMQDTPEIRPRVRPAPRMARGSRRSTRAGASRAHRSLETPTSTMVLRSRQLNPSLSADGGKPENQREREQRDAQRRQ